MKQFKHVILGGTFDHFHLGHQKLLKTAFENGEKITIGITRKELLIKKTLSKIIESYNLRKSSVSDFLLQKKWLQRSRIIPIFDIYGTTLIDKSIDVIVVSSMTKQNAVKINDKRLKIGFSMMKIIVIDDVLAEDGKLITSERIRMGEIDREGKIYDLRFKIHESENRKELVLPEEMREELRKPLGRVFKDTKSLLHHINIMKRPLVVAVGDIVVLKLLKNRINPEVKVVDFKTRRKELPIPNFSHFALRASRGRQFSIDFQFADSKKDKNDSGTINIETALKLKFLIQKRGGWLVVDGEEDLLTLPAILFAPLGSLVLYGQWNVGAIAVEVTEKIKNKAKRLLANFT